MLLMGVLWGGVWAAEQPSEHSAQQELHEVAEEVKEEGFDVVGLIFDHISDSYSWHIATYKGHHIEIPLLCIVRSESGRWYAFSSSEISHGHHYEGFYVAPKGEKWE